MSIEVVTFGCRLNASEVRNDAPSRGGGRSRRHDHHQLLRGHRRGRAPGAPNHPPPEARAARAPGRRHRLRRADRGAKRSLPCPRSTRCSATADKLAAESWAGLRARSISASTPGRRSRSTISAWCARRRCISIDGFDGRARAFVQVQNGCDHRCTFCIIPYGRGPSRSVPAGEVVAHVRALAEHGYRRGRAHRRRSHRLGRTIFPAAATRRARPRDPPPRAGIAAAAYLLARSRRDRCRSFRRHRRGRAPDAASASVAAGRRRFDSEAHEAPPSPRRRDPVLRRSPRASGPTSSSARISSPAFPTETRSAVPQYAFASSTTAASPSSTCFRSRRAKARRPRACRKVRGEVVKERAGRLRDKGETALRRHLASEIGRRRRVLVEGADGRTEHYARVRLARLAAPGAILDLRIVGHDGHRLVAA